MCYHRTHSPRNIDAELPWQGCRLVVFGCSNVRHTYVWGEGTFTAGDRKKTIEKILKSRSFTFKLFSIVKFLSLAVKGRAPVVISYKIASKDHQPCHGHLLFSVNISGLFRFVIIRFKISLNMIIWMRNVKDCISPGDFCHCRLFPSHLPRYCVELRLK